MDINMNDDGMRKIQEAAKKKMNADWKMQVDAVAASHGDRTKDEIKAELARRFRKLFNGTLSDDQLNGEAQRIIDRR